MERFGESILLACCLGFLLCGLALGRMDQLERFPPENLAAAHFTTQQAGQAMTCLHDNTVEIPAQRQKALELVETSLWTVEATLAPFAGAPER